MSGGLLLVLGGAVVAYARTLPNIPGQRFGAALFPNVIGYGLIACSLLLIVQGARRWRAEPLMEPAHWMRSPRLTLNFLLVPGVLLFYVLAADPLGFLICGAIALLVLFLALGVRPWRALLLSPLLALALHFVFYKLLRVPLPWGLLAPFAWS
ncbi:MAG: tripartite tricarboxylate transporter TctB family protein [Gammaproteobacteria bacterium]